jgi:hypothetical protein
MRTGAKYMRGLQTLIPTGISRRLIRYLHNVDKNTKQYLNVDPTDGFIERCGKTQTVHIETRMKCYSTYRHAKIFCGHNLHLRISYAALLKQRLLGQQSLPDNF